LTETFLAEKWRVATLIFLPFLIVRHGAKIRDEAAYERP
jgi:hypothetical protein